MRPESAGIESEGTPGIPDMSAKGTPDSWDMTGNRDKLDTCCLEAKRLANV
jgi:hypothetical protein